VPLLPAVDSQCGLEDTLYQSLNDSDWDLSADNDSAGGGQLEVVYDQVPDLPCDMGDNSLGGVGGEEDEGGQEQLLEVEQPPPAPSPPLLTPPISPHHSHEAVETGQSVEDNGGEEAVGDPGHPQGAELPLQDPEPPPAPTPPPPPPPLPPRRSQVCTPKIDEVKVLANVIRKS